MSETTSGISSAPTAGPAGQAPVSVGVDRDSCASCGVRLAADQRYCVECGQARSGATRLPSFEPAIPAGEATVVGGRSGPPPASPTSWRSPSWRSPNATVFAVVGALLLAMGVGVLIGRSDTRSTSTGGQRVTTVVLSGTGAAVSAAAPTTVAPTPATGTTAASAAAAGAKKAAAAKTPPPKTPALKAVKVGSSGTGPGYQKGKFTGNFFGGG